RGALGHTDAVAGRSPTAGRGTRRRRGPRAPGARPRGTPRRPLDARAAAARPSRPADPVHRDPAAGRAPAGAPRASRTGHRAAGAYEAIRGGRTHEPRQAWPGGDGLRWFRRGVARPAGGRFVREPRYWFPLRFIARWLVT